MKQVLTAALFLVTVIAHGQNKKYTGLSFLTTHSALPFSKFGGLFSETIHPGFEFTYGKNFSMKPKHDWFLEYKFSYFFHRFVQHGLPLYMDLGYRYHISKKFSVETSFGAGIMKSIPATQVFSQQIEGYKKEKGKSRWQLIGTYNIGLGYTINPGSKLPYRLFTSYQQRIQYAFVKSYVPLLPYNSMMLGISKTIGKKKKS